MGMASSQVRLLMITNRLHDIEYKAACIQNAKILLGNLEDDAYKKYNDALEGNNVITIGGEAANGMLKFSQLVNGLGLYMTDNSGNVYVSEAARNAFEELFPSSDTNTDNITYDEEAYRKFAWMMKNNGDTNYPEKAEQPTFVNNTITYDDPDPTANGLCKLEVQKDTNGNTSYTYKGEGSSEEGGKTYIYVDPTLIDELNDVGDGTTFNLSEDTISRAQCTYNQTTHKWERIYTADQQLADWKAGKLDTENCNATNYIGNANIPSYEDVELYNTFKNADTSYMQMFNDLINARNNNKMVFGSQDYDNLNAYDLANLINANGLSLKNASYISKDTLSTVSGDNHWNISVDPSNPFSYSVDTAQDKTAIAKASAEYENELRKIDRKEKQYDTELAKIETERNALTKEMEGLKKVKDDNIDRTFGIFS